MNNILKIVICTQNDIVFSRIISLFIFLFCYLLQLKLFKNIHLISINTWKSVCTQRMHTHIHKLRELERHPTKKRKKCKTLILVQNMSQLLM